MKYGDQMRGAVREDYMLGLPVTLIGKVHGVSDVTIRRWIKEENWQRDPAPQSSDGDTSLLSPGTPDSLLPRLLFYAGRLLDRLNAFLELEDVMAPRDLKSISGTMIDVLNLEKQWRERQDAETKAGESWTVNIINQDWGDEDAQH